MKIRSDFVTNSSSSSFIVTNNSGETLTSREFVEKMFEKILRDSEDQFTLGPGESMEITCSDGEDNFERFIHDCFSSFGMGDFVFNMDEVEVQFKESYH